MNRPRLIATDLDGTFLSPDGTISATNLAAVRLAADHGVPFVVATGRPTRWLGVVTELATAHSKVIVSNGAAVVDLASLTVLEDYPLTEASALGVAADLRRAIDGISFGFESGTDFGCEPDSPSRQRHEPGANTGDPATLISKLGRVIKLLGFHPELSSDELIRLATPVVGDRLTLTYAATSYRYGMIEMTAPGVTKATTLARLCESLGVAPDEVAAFGDMPNDEAMLRWAGQGFVVANGHPSMLSGGFAVVGSNSEDGVGRTIVELLG